MGSLARAAVKNGYCAEQLLDRLVRQFVHDTYESRQRWYIWCIIPRDDHLGQLDRADTE